MAETLFAAEGVGKRFGRTTVLKAASFWVRSDEVTALLGRNGCGKTTLLHCALGEKRRDYGLVRFRGEVVESPRLWKFGRKGLWYVDQDARLPVTKDLGRLVRITERRAGTSGEEWVERLRLETLLPARIPELSRGERKRAALAVALISGATCLILDEPFESVTPQDKELLSECIGGLVGRGVGVLLTGHDARVILTTATRVTWCVAGTTHDLGTVDLALDHPQFVREYLGPGFRRGGGTSSP